MKATTTAPPIDHGLLRETMGRFATGVTVIATAAGGKVHGMTANAFMSGSLEPPLCLISVARKARMHEFLERAGHFSVNMLRHDQERLSQHFAGQPVEGLSVPFDYVGKTPILAGGLATIAADIIARHECGDHSLFIGRIFHLEAHEGEPLLFFSGRYASLVRRPAGETLPNPEFW